MLRLAHVLLVGRGASRLAARAGFTQERHIMRASVALLLLTLATGMPFQSAGAYTLTLNSGGTTLLSSSAFDSSFGGSGALNQVNPAALPYSPPPSTAFHGTASSSSAYALFDTNLSVAISHTRPNGLSSSSRSSGNIYFSVDQTTEYLASGQYFSNDPDGRQLYMGSTLQDLTTGEFLFISAQHSLATPFEGFILGEIGGDFDSQDTGALTGVLIAEHDYHFSYTMYTVASPTAATVGAIANGDITLALTPVPIPEDADRFLTFLNEVSPEHAEDENSALAYYATIDPNETRETLDDWLIVNGFPGGATASATYVNEADLGFGRSMFIKTHLDGRVASYVVNHGDDTSPTPADPTADPVDGTAEEKIDNVHDGLNIIATVAMEYGPPDDDPSADFFTTFYAFGPDGNRLQQADLDGRGAKSLPGACNICHGGNPRPVLEDGRYPGRGDTGAGFLPWDLEAFGFSETLYGGLPIYNRTSQEADFKALNEAVLATNPNDTTREVIEEWYGGAGLPNPMFNGMAVPGGWEFHEAAYREVFAPNCRACHMMRSPALAFQTYSEFVLLRDRANHLVFDRSIMPLARRTYDRFWASFPGVDDPEIIDLFGVIPASRKPGVGTPLPFAGPNVDGVSGFPTQLDARDSSYATSFSWVGVGTTLDDPSIETPTFVPGLAGDYEFELTTSNSVGSTTDVVVVSVTNDGGDPGIDFETQVFPLFVQRCEFCHDGSPAPDFLGGVTSPISRVQKIYQAFSSRVSVLDPSNSLLVQKSGGALGHGGGIRLSIPTEVEALMSWIEEGAKRSTRPAHYARLGCCMLPVPISTLGGILLPTYDGVDLGPGAILNGADLSGANLQWADLRFAFASGTRFIGTTLVNADLSGADLSGADLSGANLHLANLTGAALSGATYDENTIFPSGTTYDIPPLGLSGGSMPWELGMIAVPEPGFELGLAFGTILVMAAAGRSRRGDRQNNPRFPHHRY